MLVVQPRPLCGYENGGDIHSVDCLDKQQCPCVCCSLTSVGIKLGRLDSLDELLAGLDGSVHLPVSSAV